MNSFTSKRLTFRPITTADQSFFAQQYTNANIMRHNGGALTRTDAIQQHTRLMRDNQRAQNGDKKTIVTWAIVCRNSQNIIGILTLCYLTFPYNSHVIKQGLNSNINQAEVGIILVEQQQNKGFAQEALNALIHFSFNVLALTKINAFYNRDNAQSEKLFTRLGFSYDDNSPQKNTDKHYCYLEKR